MPAHRTVALGLVALLAFSAVAAAGAHGDHAHEKAPFQDHEDQHDDHADESADEADDADDAGPPEEAHFGLCTAWNHIPGQAQDVGPFSGLTQALCEDVSHPGDGHDGADARPDDAGPPS